MREIQCRGAEYKQKADGTVGAAKEKRNRDESGWKGARAKEKYTRKKKN